MVFWIRLRIFRYSKSIVLKGYMVYWRLYKTLLWRLFG
jgi:hypothetical protein